jgi:hypothetical protein
MQKPGPDDALEVGPPMKAEKKAAQERGGQGRALLASIRGALLEPAATNELAF